MKNKKLKLVNIAAVVIFAVAFFLNIQSGFHEGHGFLGLPAIGEGTGSGSGGSGSGNYTVKGCEHLDSSGNIDQLGNTCPSGTANCIPNNCDTTTTSFIR